MAWGNFLRKALPIAAGVFGTPALGAAVGGAMGAWGAYSDARAQEKAAAQAGNTAQGGFNYLSSSPMATQYMPAGGAAVNQQAGLLGIGGDPAAANQGYQNYLSSVGYQGQLQSGMDAIEGSAAASNSLNSGATLKALQAYGTQLGQQNFNNYFSQLSGIANQGLQANQTLGSAATSAANQAASYGYQGATAAAGARQEGWDQIAGGLGGVYEAWQNGRAPAPNPAGMKRLPSGRVAQAGPGAPQAPSIPLDTRVLQNWLRRGV